MARTDCEDTGVVHSAAVVLPQAATKTHFLSHSGIHSYMQEGAAVCLVPTECLNHQFLLELVDGKEFFMHWPTTASVVASHASLQYSPHVCKHIHWLLRFDSRFHSSSDTGNLCTPQHSSYRHNFDRQQC